MELYTKAESERLARVERQKRRQLRITQVRQQTSDWTSKSREEYKAEKDRQFRLIFDSFTDDVQAEAVECIKYHVEAHTMAMSEIGTAHKAAASVPDFQQAMSEQKLVDAETAEKRHKNALKHKRSLTTSENLKANEVIRRKLQVRFDEDAKAKELVEKLPFGVRNLESDISKKCSKRQMSEYQQSLAKSLYVPPTTAEKENVSLRKKSRPIKKAVRSPNRKQGAFSKIAEVRRAGATTPDLATIRIISTDNVPSPKLQHKKPDVIYFDASLPRPPQKYRPPSGLVERVPRKLSEPTAWTGAKQVNQELLKVKLRKSLDEIEKQKVAEQRGRTALKIAKLEQEFKQLEVDLAHGEEFESWPTVPVPSSSEKISLLGLDDPLNLTSESSSSRKSDTDKVDQRVSTSIRTVIPFRSSLNSTSSSISSSASSTPDRTSKFKSLLSEIPSFSSPPATQNSDQPVSTSIKTAIPFRSSLNTTSSFISSSANSTPDPTSKFKILLSEISSFSSSTTTQSSGTDYYNPPDRSSTTNLRQSRQELEVGPVTSTPESVRKNTVSRSVIFKYYLNKLLASRPESIDLLSSPSTINSYVLLHSSATISSTSTPSTNYSTTSNSTPSSNDLEGSTMTSISKLSPSYDQIDNTSCSFTQPSYLPALDISSSTKTETTTTDTSSSTDALIQVRVMPNEQSPSNANSQSNTDESLTCALSALCVRQEHVITTLHNEQEVAVDSGSTQYFSADQKESSISGSSEDLFRPRTFEPPGEEHPPNSQTSGSGDMVSKEYGRGSGDTGETIISRPSPDVQVSLEQSALQQLTNDWMNISIERPPWL